MRRVVLATMGSWGDIFPVIGLAKGLAQAGHDARIAASPAYGELVRGEGLGFSGIGPALSFSDYAADPKILSGRLGGFVGFAHLFRRFIFPALDQYVDDLAASIRGADLLLAHPALVAAPVAAESMGGPVGHDQRLSWSHPDYIRSAGTDARVVGLGSDRASDPSSGVVGCTVQHGSAV